MKTSDYLWMLSVVATVALSLMRAVGFSSQPYQATAHVVVGGFVGAAIAGKSWWYGGLAIFLSVVEVACFVAFKF